MANTPDPAAIRAQNIRAFGAIRARFEARAGRSFVASLHEAGGLRLKFPRAPRDCEAVVVNTAGGVVAGDQADLSFAAGEGARAILTTQSAEKIYRSEGATARIALRLAAGAGARLDWMPQETILFDQARLERRLEADMAADATLTVLEAITFGRLSMGEVTRTGLLCDRWRVRRNGVLIFAEAMRLGEDIAGALDRPAMGGGARAVATLLHVAPDAAARVDALREAAAPFENVEAGFSAWNGMLVGRLVSASPEALRACIVSLLTILRGGPPPRVWR